MARGNKLIKQLTPVLSTKDKKALRDRIVVLLLEGKSTSSIYNTLQPETGLSQYYIYNIINDARKVIRETISIDLDDILNHHIALYEKAYEYFHEIGNTPGKMKALFYKEKLLGFHIEAQTIEINNEVNVELHKEDETYDIERLGEDEKKRLQFLLKKVKEVY